MRQDNADLANVRGGGYIHPLLLGPAHSIAKSGLIGLQEVVFGRNKLLDAKTLAQDITHLAVAHRNIETCSVTTVQQDAPCIFVPERMANDDYRSISNRVCDIPPINCYRCAPHRIPLIHD